MVLELEKFIASQLTQRITFLKKETTRDEIGNPIETWLEAFETWAEVFTIGGEEGRVAAAESSLVKYIIRIRDIHADKINPTMRIMWKKIPLNITVIRKPDAVANYLEISAEHKQRDIHG